MPVSAPPPARRTSRAGCFWLVVIGIIGLLYIGGRGGSNDSPTGRATIMADVATPTAMRAAATPTPAFSPAQVAQIAATAAAVRSAEATAAPTPTPAPRDKAEVIEVVDGDAIKVRFGHGEVREIRYLDLVVPNASQCFGAESAAKNAELLTGKSVELGAASEAAVMRNVWAVGDDGATRSVQEEMVKWGFAGVVSSRVDSRNETVLRGLVDEARREKRGLWERCSGPAQSLPTPTPRPPSLGDTIASSNWRLKVVGVERLPGNLVWGEFGSSEPPIGQWFVVIIEVTNTGNRNFTLNTWDFDLRIGGATINHTTDSGATYSYPERRKMVALGKQIPPGTTITTPLVFDIPRGAQNISLIFAQVKDKPIKLA